MSKEDSCVACRTKESCTGIFTTLQKIQLYLIQNNVAYENDYMKVASEVGCEVYSVLSIWVFTVEIVLFNTKENELQKEDKQ